MNDERVLFGTEMCMQRFYAPYRYKMTHRQPERTHHDAKVTQVNGLEADSRMLSLAHLFVIFMHAMVLWSRISTLNSGHLHICCRYRLVKYICISVLLR